MTHYVRDQIAQLAGRNCDEAFHNLIEMPDSVLSELIEAFHSETDGSRRAQLVEIVWHHRSGSQLEFLGEALFDVDDRVWKQALDGIVSIGGKHAIEILQAAKTRTIGDNKSPADFIGWLSEAVQQIENAPDVS